MSGHHETPEHDALDGALRALAQEDAGAAPGSHVEAALLRAWDVAHPAPVRRWTATRLAAPLAAGLLLSVSLAQLGTTLQRASSAGDAVQPTLLLVGEPLAAGEAIHIVRMRVPAVQAAELGLATRQTTGDIDIDVLVGEDGVARAIRLGT